jgi:hypothetical protein
LLRFIAHAHLVVDLRPGAYIARECVESLRFGVPFVAPDGTAAAQLAAAGGGLWYRDVGELLEAVALLHEPFRRDALGARGRAIADAQYGDPQGFVTRVARAMDRIRSTPSPVGPP